MLSAILDKAEAFAATKKIDPAALLHSPVAGYVRSQPAGTSRSRPGETRRGAARWAEPPSYEDNETTIGELKARLAKTLGYLKTLDGKAIDASAEREIVFPLGGGNTGHMQGSDYLNHYVLPNFYFHVTAAYAILRHCGVEIGKRDFLGAIPITRT